MFDYSFQQENSFNIHAFAVSSSLFSSDLNWFPNTGATNHVIADLANLSLQADGYNGTDKLHVGNGRGLTIHHTGSSKLIFPCATFMLKHLFHVLHIKKNLLSVSQFTRDNNVYFEFYPSIFCVKDPLTGNTLLHGHSRDGLYTFPTCPPPLRLALLGECASTNRWHCKLGHPSLCIISRIVHTHHLTTLKNKVSGISPACRMGKSHKLLFHLSPSVSHFPLELIFTDVWGPSPFYSNNGNWYYVCFIDDFSKFVWLFPIATKSVVTSIFLKFRAHVEKLFDKKIKAIQSD